MAWIGTQNEVAAASLDSLAEDMHDLESRSASVASFVAAKTGSQELDVAAVANARDNENDGIRTGGKLAPHDAYMSVR